MTKNITLTTSELAELVDAIVSRRIAEMVPTATVVKPAQTRTRTRAANTSGDKGSRRHKVIPHSIAKYGDTLNMSHEALVAGGFTAEIERRAANRIARGAKPVPTILAERADKVADKPVTWENTPTKDPSLPNMSLPMAERVARLLESKPGKKFTPAKVAKHTGLTEAQCRTQLYVLCDPNKAGSRLGRIVKVAPNTFKAA